MIVQPATVELTKIHYYHGRNTQISTISREIFDNQINNTAIIKKNIFGHKWVLKINETQTKNESKLRIIIYILVFSCIVIAVCFGLFFSLEPKFRPKITTTNNNQTLTYRNSSKFSENITKWNYCDCTKNQICLKQNENDTPKCNEAIDRNDPTGCGGFCSINTQFCQLLDNQQKIYQCNPLKNVLKCPENFFNCGNMCVNKTKKCDGFIDCSNGSDEINCDCDLLTHFRCVNLRSCLPKEKKCDGTVDCWDKSDEFDCYTGCHNDSMACRNGDCIRKENFCDGFYHCSDKSDEPQGCQL